MYLDSIEISNYRQYYNTQKITFGYTENNNLIIIEGDNGRGKTTLVNALTWCLYGQELHDKTERTEPLYNLSYGEELLEKNEEFLTVRVKIKLYEIINNEKEFFNISRDIEYQQTIDSKWTTNHQTNLVVEKGGEFFRANEAQYLIQDIIPQEMFSYFFFNGATLANYFDTSSELNLKKSVKEISQLDLLDTVYEHINGTLTELNKQYKAKKPVGEKNYNELIHKKSIEKSELENKQKKVKEDIEKAIINIHNCEEELGNNNSEAISKLNNDRKQLKESLEKSNALLKKNNEEYENLILDLYPLTMLFEELIGAYNIAEKSREKGKIPSDIETNFIKDLIEEGTCICGIDLNDNPNCLNTLKKRMNETSDVTKDLFYTEYNSIVNSLKELKNIEKIEYFRNNIKQISDSIEKDKKQLEDISEKLSKSNEEKVRTLERQLKINTNEKQKLIQKSEELDLAIDKLGKDISSLETEQDTAEKNQALSDELNEEIKFARDALNSINDLSENIQKHIREKINDLTKKQFIDIDKYVDVNINENYKISIEKKAGNLVYPVDLSDGERNLLALSFIMALHNLSGFEIPLIIDAPFEKWDETKRIEFCSGVHEYTKNKQIIFLLTNTQYTTSVRNELFKHVSDEYSLKYENYKTEIVKYE